jgi:hypothetical protein
MKTLIYLLAAGAMLVWSLLCWLAYGFADVLEDWAAANAAWIAGDAVIGGLIQTLLNAGQGLGLIVTLLVWGLGMLAIFVPTWLLGRLFRRRPRLAPAYSGGQAMPPQEPFRPRHSSAHVGKAGMIGKVMDAARKYR